MVPILLFPMHEGEGTRVKTPVALGATAGLVVSLLLAGSSHGNDRHLQPFVLPGFLDGSMCTYYVPKAGVGQGARVPLVLSVSGWSPTLNEYHGMSSFLATAGYPVVNTPGSANVAKTANMVRDAFNLVDLIRLEKNAFMQQVWRQRERGHWGYLMAADALGALHKRTTTERVVVIAHCAGVKPALEAVKDLLTARRSSPPPQVEFLALNPSNAGQWYTSPGAPSLVIRATHANDPVQQKVLKATHEQALGLAESFGGDWERVFGAWHQGQLGDYHRAVVEQLDVRAPIKAISKAVYRDRFRMTILAGKNDEHMPPELHGARLHSWLHRTKADTRARFIRLDGARHWFEGVRSRTFNNRVLLLTDQHAGRRDPRKRLD